MSALIGLLKNILKLIGVLFKFIFINIEDGVGTFIMGRSKNKKFNKKMVYSSIAREDEEKEAKVRKSKKGQVSWFDAGLEDEYLYTTGTRWSRVED